MASGHTVLLVVPCALIAVLAYNLYVPVPDGMAQPWKTEVILSLAMLPMKMFQLMENLGITNSIFLMRRMETFMRKSHPTLKIEDTQFEGVKVRIYRPKAGVSPGQPAIVYFHGGGFTLGSADLSDVITGRLAGGVKATVVSVEYRLAPENKFPAAFDDCETATRYLLRNAKDFGVDPSRVALAGDSAGGNLAAAVALKLRNMSSDLPKVKLQVLLYPALQAIDFQTPSYHFSNTPTLTRRQTVMFWLNYAQGHSRNAAVVLANNHTAPHVLEQLHQSHLDWSRLQTEFNTKPVESRCNGCGDAELWAEIGNVFMNPYFAPLMADDLRDLPPAYIVTANNDVLRDDGAMYADRLRKAGNKVTYKHWLASFHDIIFLSGLIPEADESLDEIVRFLAKNL